MEPSKKQEELEKAFSILLPDIDQMLKESRMLLENMQKDVGVRRESEKRKQPRPPTGRKLNRARQVNNLRRLPTVQGEEGKNNSLLYGLKLADNIMTEVAPKKQKSPSFLPAIKKSRELVACRDNTSSENLQVAAEPRPPTDKKQTFRRKYKSSTQQPTEGDLKPSPPKEPKQPTAPSSDSSKSGGNCRRRKYKLQ